jgi:hypothetical protein
MELVNGRWPQSATEEVVIEHVELLRLQPTERNSADRRAKVDANKLLVPLPSPGTLHQRSWTTG